MNLIKRYNEYMGPKDERLDAAYGRTVRVGYYLFLTGICLCLFYYLMVGQVSQVAEVPLFTPAGDAVFAPATLLLIVFAIASFVPLAMQLRAGIVDTRMRYAQTDRIPWDFVALVSLLVGLVLGVLTAGMRMIAEIQIVGVEHVAWFGDLAIGVVFFLMGFTLGIAALALQFSAAIKRRQELERELED